MTAIAALIAALLTLTGCYHRGSYGKRPQRDTVEQSKEQIDSLTFAHGHHYSENYNFIIKADSLVLLAQQPEEYISGMETDTVCMQHAERVVVADIRILPSDPTDSVWVQVARDQTTFGWIHEHELLQKVVPDDPISQFISIFSDTHLLITLITICLIAIAYLLRNLYRRGARIVLFNDIASFYPTLLTLIVSAAATFYASLQMFAPDTWQHFYFHPTLNPFSASPLLAIFLTTVWLMLIVFVATVDEVRHRLPLGEAILYLCGLCGICALCYIVFSLTTLYHVGYPLLAAFCTLTVRRYFLKLRHPYICGNCGARMRHKGRCPQCGAINS